MTKAPWEWCDPRNAFGQLTDKFNNDIIERHWNHHEVQRPGDELAFRAAVTQSVICLYVRQAKNSRPHPNDKEKPFLDGRTFPLEALADLDPRGLRVATWQAKLTGRRALTVKDIDFLKRLYPDEFPTDAEIQVFIDVAEKRKKPRDGWGRNGHRWPDT